MLTFSHSTILLNLNLVSLELKMPNLKLS